jgi:hypothetical protein
MISFSFLKGNTKREKFLTLVASTTSRDKKEEQYASDV